MSAKKSGRRQFLRNTAALAGLAWSGAGAVKRVEVSTDNGKTWKDAELQGPVPPRAHTRFTLPWKWEGQETILWRTTDDRGQVQPSLAEMAKLWGVDVSYFQESQAGHANAIQPWRVAADGKVYNAIFV